MKSSIFRKLSNKEAQKFQEWAQENWKVGDKVRSIWHPVVQEECAKILDEHIRANTKKYDAGTLDWNFAYKDMVVAIDSSSDEIVEKEQYEMAIEHFWESEWEEATS
tara:strand:+ start:1620 stop:1940 length:321 start_codon:yes stop_codon:yes gene_type:complete